MKPDHDAVIEAMAEAIAGSNHDDYMLLNIFEREPYQEDAKAALQAAAERGYVLAKLPERRNLRCSDNDYFKCETDGWNTCLDAIEIIRVESPQ